MKCPECGTDVADNVTVCPSCGYEIVQSETEAVGDNTNTTVTVPVYKNKKYIGIALCVVACIMLIVAFTRINNDTYSFYKQHYKECMEGYAENSADARNSGSLFSGTYRYIASEYEDMAKDDNKKIWEYRIQAIILCLGGIACGVVGYKFIKGRKRMALVKCPECGRENVSSTAKSCPGCGYNIKAYYEEEQQKEVASNSAAPTNKINVKAIIGVAVACIVVFCIYYFSTRCAFDGCTEKRTENSKYCAYHSLSNSYGSSYDYVPKTGNAGAKAKAESYLNSSAFSYTGLIHQLEYEGFSTSEATYGADNCGANWKEQALKKAKSYLNSSAFSYSGLKEQLEYNGFTEDEAQYGVDNCNADWNDQAYKKAKSYMKSSPDMGRSRLIEQLQYNGFTYKQAVYGVDQAGL